MTALEAVMAAIDDHGIEEFSTGWSVSGVKHKVAHCQCGEELVGETLHEASEAWREHRAGAVLAACGVTGGAR